MKKWTKRIGGIGLLLILKTTLVAQNVNFTIRVTGLQQPSGKLQIAVYNDKNGFLTPERVYKNIVLDVNKSILKHTIEIPKGNYAVALYHDNNSNGICDKNLFGIPVERYGFSNNIRPILSAPSFQSTVIEVKKDLEIEIALLK
ncbi:DUF2141 domain-containing protein [Aureispira anguillae]|uniref:DUF2141 domain-containing protein n=1 Tax=Aureispira anguillae TaxID=2864201 RepID=A0A916DQW6_9BACT|nr:DUF2141 domain-containing protein [Aureispira anguillae]BDS09866.1 DUF2141 domain-containing protein [Aureispira anguillae]